MTRFRLIALLLVILTAAGAGGWALWHYDLRWRPKTITKHQEEITQLLETAGWVSPGLKDKRLYMVSFRTCPDCLRFKAEEFPALHAKNVDTRVIEVARADNAHLPGRAQIIAKETELSEMFLIESERGCSRGCTYCVMRRGSNGGMRLASPEVILAAVPPEAKKVGLVGAAVSDHPRIVDIVNTLADRGLGVGLSSLRPDRLTDAFVGALKRGGYKTLTTAMDGPSERLRASLERRAKVNHLERAAELARAHAMQTLKLYLMVGLPSETDDDIDECVDFVGRLSAVTPVALGIAPFVSKRRTPLDGLPFAGIDVVEGRLDRLRKGLRGRADVRPTSARWAWVEWVLAQGDRRAGRAVLDAMAGGGRFSDYKRAFEAAGVVPGKKRRLMTVGADR
jgi:radical SAM superfamily enzyme YgiQ (UPF0313 family)